MLRVNERLGFRLISTEVQLVRTLSRSACARGPRPAALLRLQSSTAGGYMFGHFARWAGRALALTLALAMKYLTAIGLVGMLAAGLFGYASLVRLLAAQVPPPPPGCQRSHLEVTASVSYSSEENGRDGWGFTPLLNVHRFCDSPADTSDHSGFYPP
jgi:hypothetical protein